MKKKCLALLCALCLVWPVSGLPDEEGWQCDNCDAYGPASVAAGEEGWSGDAYGREMYYYCGSCGALLASSWQELTPPAEPEPAAEPQPQPAPQPQPEPQPEPQPAAQPEPEPPAAPAPDPEPAPQPEAPAAPPADSAPAGNAGEPETPAEVPAVQVQDNNKPADTPSAAAPAKEESPVSVPAENPGSGASGGASESAVSVKEDPPPEGSAAQAAEPAGVNPGNEVPVQLPSGGNEPASSGETREDLPPVIPQAQDSAPQDAPAAEEAPEAPEEEPEAWDAMNDPPVTQPSAGNGNTGPVTRNLVKYPVFSSFWPSRRLNMEGDPEAQAPIPGEKIWPASFLDHLTK